MSQPRRKSITMFARIDELKWQVREDKDRKYLRISPKHEFVICDGSLKDWSKPFVSIGEEAEKREIILVDPNSDIVNVCYETLKAKIQKGNIEIIAATVMTTVNELFNSIEIESICSAWSGDKYQNIPVIPLDDFIKAKAGICRHKVLLKNILFYKLKQESLMDDCDIYLLRGFTTSGEGHACTVLIPKDMSPANALLVDASLHDKPYWVYEDEHQLDANFVQLCKTRYLTPSVDFFKQLNPANVRFRFYVKENKCIYRDSNTKLTDRVTHTFIVHGEIGSGSYGTVYKAESIIKPVQYVAIKTAKITTEYAIDTPDDIIKHNVMRSNAIIARELPFTRQINGRGAVFCANDPILIEVVNGKKVLKSYPCVSLAMEWIEGKAFSEYKITSPEHFRKVAISLCKAVRTIHKDKIVLEDIHATNVKIIEDKDRNITARFFDHSISQNYNQFLSLDQLSLSIKPKYFAGKKVIRAHYADDINCLALMLDKRFKQFGFDKISPQIQAILSLMLEANPSSAITLDEVIKSFEDIPKERLNPFDLNIRINAEDYDVQLPLFIIKFNFMTNKNDRESLLKFIGIQFFKHQDKNVFLSHVNALHKDRARELLIFLYKSEREEQAKRFPSPNAINQWCYLESMLYKIRTTSYPAAYFSLFNERYDYKPHISDDIFNKMNLIYTLEKIEVKHRFAFLIYLIDTDVRFFDNIYIADKYKKIENLTHSKTSPKCFLQLMVRKKQSSFECEFEKESKSQDDTLARWLFCEVILHHLDSPTCNIDLQFMRFRVINCDPCANFFQRHPSKILSTLKKPFPAEKLRLLKLVHIELIDLSFSDLTHVYHYIPSNQQQDFLNLYKPSREAIKYIISDYEGYGCYPIYLKEKQKLAMMLTQGERHLAYTQLLRNMSIKLQTKYKASDNEATQALFFDQWLYIESILSDPNNIAKTAAAIEKLSNTWNIGHGAHEYSEVSRYRLTR